MYDWRKAWARLQDMEQASYKFQWIYWIPLTSRFDLNGLAQIQDETNRFLRAQDFDFYATQIGGNGRAMGFDRNLRGDDTNLTGSGGSLPGGFAFITKQMGLYFSPQAPIPVKEHLENFTFLSHVAQSNVLLLGPSRYWPAAEFGVQSRSVDSNIPNDFVQFATNGAVPMRVLPEDAELTFPPNKQILIRLSMTEGLFLTTNGQAFNGQNGIVGPVFIGYCMVGWKIEGVRAA